MQTRRLGGISLLLGTLAFLSSGAGRASADLALTQTAADQGFTLTTFANNFISPVPAGPLGMTFPASGGVLVTDYLGNLRLFPTTNNGQNAANISVSQSYGLANALGLAQLNNSIYMTEQAKGALVQLNSNGTLNQTVIPSGLTNATGIVANPVNGHLYISTPNASGSGVIYDVNPLTGAVSHIPNVNGWFDGLAVSPDGQILYAATKDGAVGFNIATGNQVFQTDPSQPIEDADGIALGTGNLAGMIFINTNDVNGINGGTVVAVSLTNPQLEFMIATGGTRGDFVAVAPDGSLFLTQSDSIARLTAPPGSAFLIPFAGGPIVPEPSSFALLGFGSLALLGWRRWRGFSG